MKTFFRFIKHYIDPRSTLWGVLIASGSFFVALYVGLKDLASIQMPDQLYWPAVLAIMGYLVTGFIKTRMKRYNTLCYLEAELNQALDASYVMISTLKNMIPKANPLLLPHERLFLSLDLLKEVGRLDVKNNLANLICDFRRINQDWDNLILFGNKNEQVIKNPTHLQHQSARVFGTQMLEKLLVRTKSSYELIRDTLCLVRIYMRYDRSFYSFRQPFVWPRKLITEIQNEKKILEQELEVCP